MVACISPSHKDYTETLSTLRYANRAKNIHNKPRVNEDPKDATLRKYQEEIERLKKQLENRQNTPLKSEIDDNHNSAEVNKNISCLNADLDAKRDKLIQEYQAEMEKLKNLHENEKTEKENVLKQIEAIKEEYEKNIEKLNAEMKNKHERKVRSKEEILQRIEELKAVMIGGEKADDKELSERRKRKKLAAQRRAR